MYLEIFLADFAVFRFLGGIFSRDFAEIPEFCGSATTRNIRSPAYLLSLSLSLQCLVNSLKVSSSCTSLISGFFFIQKPLTRGLCLLNFPQSPLLKIVNLASLLFPIPPGCPRVLSQEKADDHDMCIRQPFSLIIIFQAHLVILLHELQQLLSLTI